MMGLRIAVASIVVVALAGGCASSTAPRKTAAPSQRPTAGALPAGSPLRPAGTPSQDGAAVRAHDVLVTLADLPSGWKTEPMTTSAAEQRREDDFFDHCLDVPTIETVQAANVTDQFQSSDGLAFVDSNVVVTQTAHQAAVDKTALTSGKQVRCSDASARTFLKPPAGGRILSISAQPLPVPTGDFAVRVVARLQLKGGQQITLYIDNVGLVVKRYEVQVSFESVLQTPEPSFERATAGKVFARAQRLAT